MCLMVAHGGGGVAELPVCGAHSSSVVRCANAQLTPTTPHPTADVLLHLLHQGSEAATMGKAEEMPAVVSDRSRVFHWCPPRLVATLRHAHCYTCTVRWPAGSNAPTTPRGWGQGILIAIEM